MAAACQVKENHTRLTFGGACIFSSTEACRVSGTCQTHNRYVWVLGGSLNLLGSFNSGGLCGTCMQYLENGRVIARSLWEGE